MPNNEKTINNITWYNGYRLPPEKKRKNRTGKKDLAGFVMTSAIQILMLKFRKELSTASF
jgi:hypothetical protein